MVNADGAQNETRGAPVHTPLRARSRPGFFTLALLAATVCLAAAPSTLAEPPAPELSHRAERWVKRTLKHMTLEEKVGQLLMVPYFGGFANTQSPEYRELVREVQQLHVGGFIVATRPRKPVGFDRSEIYALAQLTNQLQSLAETPLLVSADFERGASFRVRDTTSFPHNMAVGAADDPQLAYDMGRIAATEARALGVHWLLAPVADLNANPLNPIINIRSFGEDPAAVSQLVAAFVHGCQEAGALCTAKHFPGAGDITLDPHVELPTVTADRQHLQTVELEPFRAAIAAGVAAVMTEHILVPAFDPDPSSPATFSHAITTDLLRTQMGFDGLIVTDALTMKALSNLAWPGEAAVRAVEAGADVLLMPPEPQVAYVALLRAVQSGRLTEARVDASVTRILRAKARVGLDRDTQVDLDQLDRLLADPGSQQEAQTTADRGVVLLRDDRGFLPIDAARPQRGLLVVVSADADTYPGEALEDEMRPRVDSLIVKRADRLYFKADQVTLPPPDLYDWTVVAVIVRVADSKGNVALPDDLAALVDRALDSQKPAALVILGSPYLAQRFPRAHTVLCALSTAEVAERAAARVLFGQTTINGRLPVTIPGVAARGDGLIRSAYSMELAPPLPGDEARFRPVYQLLDQGVADGVFPGGVLAVGYQGRLAALHPFGRYRYDPDSPAVQADTLYDLASVTKVVGTTTAAMMLYERGDLPLDAPAVNYLPELKRGPDAAAKERIQIRHLLTHSSGLPGYIRFYLEVKNRQELLDHIYALPLDYPTGTRSVYSDLGIILLGEIIQRASGQPLDAFLRQNLFEHLGMRDTLYNPPPAMRDRIAPTEDDRDFRHRLIQGEVHDENAWVMGGVSSHAGLFSTGHDLAVFCQMLLNGGIYAHRRYVKRGTLALFTTEQNIPDSSRALGWDTVSEPSSSGHYFSARSFGHTGFTGTSIWIDPEKELFVVLLTNRVYPTRENDKIRSFRPQLHDAVVRALGLAPAAPPAAAAPLASE